MPEMTPAQTALWHAALAEELRAMETHGGRSYAAERIMKRLMTGMLKADHADKSAIAN